MASTEELKAKLVKVEASYRAETDEAKKAAKLQDVKTLIKAIKQREAESPAPAAEEPQREAEVDATGLMSAVGSSGIRGAMAGTLDLLPNLANLAMGGLEYGAEKITDLGKFLIGDESPTDFNFPRSATVSQAIDAGSEALGLGRPMEYLTTPVNVDTPQERMLGTASEYLAGSLGGGAALRSVPTKPPMQQVGTTPASRANTSPMFGDVASDVRIGVGSGGLGAVSREYAPEVELVAAIAGGFGAESINRLAKVGNINYQRLVADTIADIDQDIPKAMENYYKNHTLLTSLGLEDIDPFTITRSPELRSFIESAMKNDNFIRGAITTAENSAENLILKGFDDLLPDNMPKGQLAGRNIVDTSSAFINTLTKRFGERIDMAKKYVDNLEQTYAGMSPESQISVQFTDTLDDLFKQTKSQERAIWSKVDLTTPFGNRRTFWKDIAAFNRTVRNSSLPASQKSLILDVMTALKPMRKNPSYANLQDFRSAVIEAKRTFNKNGQRNLSRIISQLDDTLRERLLNSPAGAVWEEAASYTRAVHTAFNSNKLGRYLALDEQSQNIISPEATTSRMMTTGKDIADIKRVNELGTGTSPIPNLAAEPKLLAQVEEVMYSRFGQQAGLSAKETFLKKYRDLLSVFPRLGEDLANFNRDLDKGIQRISQLERRQATAVERRYAAMSRLMGAEVDDVAKTLNTLDGNQVKQLASFMDNMGHIESLRSVYIEQIIDKLTTIQPGNVRVVSSNNLGKVLKDNKALARGFNLVLDDSQREMLRKLDSANAATMSLPSRPVQGAVNEMYELSESAANAARVGGLSAGSAVARAAKMGSASIAMAANTSRMFRRVLSNMKRDEVNQVIREMIRDKDTFEKVMGMANRASADDAERIISRWAKAALNNARPAVTVEAQQE